jgi:AcrR family transcriptional regulator
VAATNSTAARRKDPAARRLEILEAAAAVALAEGLEAITYRHVADRLGCAPGLIHHYFPAVVDLVAEALTAVLDADQDASFRPAESRAESDACAGVAILLGYWTFHQDESYSRLWLDAWSMARRQAPIRSAVDDVMKRGHTRLTALIHLGIEQGRFTVAGADSVAWYLLTALDGVMVHTSVGVNQGLVDVKRTVAAFAEQELGLAPGELRTEAADQPR